MKNLPIALALLLAAPPAAVTAQVSTVAGAVGIAVVDPDGAVCLAIEDAALESGARFVLLDLSLRGRPIAARVVAPREAACGRTIIPGGDAAYEASVSPPEEVQSGIYLAAAASSPDVVVGADQARLDVDGDGALETLRVCTSSEGLHLTVWTEQGLAGARLWHRYVYLGYDLEPSCTEPEVTPP